MQLGSGNRHLRQLSDSSCTHYPPRERPASTADTGGPPSPEHLWMQARLARLCALLRHPAVPEHGPTDSDVYVPDAALSIEFQRWPTNFADRTRARQRAGARVLWMLSPDLPGPPGALFQYPAVRVSVHRKGNRRDLLQPWNDRTLNREARLFVWGTIYHLDRHAKTLNTRPIDGMTFLDEVLEGRRRWWAPGELPLLPGDRCGWVLESERLALTALRATPDAPPAPASEQAPQPVRLALIRTGDEQPVNPARPPVGQPTPTAPAAPAAPVAPAPLRSVAAPAPAPTERTTKPAPPAAPAPATARAWWRRLLRRRARQSHQGR